MPSPEPPLPPATDSAAAEDGTAATSWRARTFASFFIPNYRWFFFGQGTSVLGLWMRSAGQAWLVFDLTGNKVLLGTVAFLAQASLGAASPIGGAVADRMDKRRLLVVLTVLSATLSFLLAGLTWSGVVRPWHILLIAAAAGVVKGFEIPARQAFIVELVGRPHLANAIVLNTALFNTARVFGPALAGWLIDSLAMGIALCFLADGLSYIAFIVALARMRPEPMPRDVRALSWVARIREGFLYARGNLRVRTLLTLLAIVIGFGWGYVAIMPALAEEVLGLGAGGYGTLMSVNGAGALLGALWIAGRAAPGSRRALRAEVFRSVTIAALGVLGLGLATTPVAAGVALVVAGFGAICFLSRGNTLVQTDVPDALRGRVMSLWVLVFIGSSGVGGLLLGLAAERWSVPAAVYGSGVVCLLLAGLVGWTLPPPSDEPRHGELPPGGRAGETLDPAAGAMSTARDAATPLESETSP